MLISWNSLLVPLYFQAAHRIKFVINFIGDKLKITKKKHFTNEIIEIDTERHILTSYKLHSMKEFLVPICLFFYFFNLNSDSLFLLQIGFY